MTIIESISLALGLIYAASLLHYSGKTWGAVVTLLGLVASLVVATAWPLLLGAAMAVGLFALLAYRQPDLARGEGRENALRDLVVHFFSLSMLLVGIEYVLYHALLLNGFGGYLARPDVVDAFLPIAGGIQIKALLTLEFWDTRHPAGAVMITTVMLSSLLSKRAFCSWACPLGLAGTYLYDLRKRFIDGDALPPKWIDWPLRSLKYLLMFSLVSLVLNMPSFMLPDYLSGNYHKIADAKMGMFFASPSLLAGLVIALILVMAAWQKQAFCRYLCPYGAAMGLLSFLSPFKIRRNTSHCLINSKGMKCDKCTRACPARISVHEQITVRSDECQACMRCLSACPKKQALSLSTRWGWKMSSRGVILVLVFFLFALPLLALVTGHWHSDVTDAERLRLLPFLDMIGH